MSTVVDNSSWHMEAANRGPNLAKRLLLLFCLLLLSGALQRILGGDTVQGNFAQGYTREENSAILLVGAGTYAITGLLLLVSGKVWLPQTIKYALLLNLLAIASTVWSVNPNHTLIRSLGLTGSTVIGIWMISSFTFKEFSKQAINFSLILIFGTAILAIILPSFVYHGSGDLYGAHAGLLKGTFVHKNTMAKVLSLCLLVLMAFGQAHLRKSVFYGSLIVGFALLAQTGSAKAFASVPAGLAVAFVLSKIGQPKFRLALVIYGLLGWFVLETMGTVDWALTTILQTLDRDPTLSGRTLIWEAAISGATQQNFILGGGYEAAWQGVIGDTVRSWLGSDPGHPHNGFINTFLELGLIGIAVLLMHIFVIVRQLAFADGRADKSIVFFNISWIVLFITSNIGGTFMMLPADLYWLQFMITPALLAWSVKK